LRAFLLAAGFGTRLQPLTLRTPKCLMRIGDEVLLGHWLRKLEETGCESVLVNTHYLAGEVMTYLAGWKSSTMKVYTVHEPVLLGTAGSLLENIGFFRGARGLLIHADNLMEDNLHQILHAHEQRDARCLLTMLTFKTSKPESCGIVETDEAGVLTGFHEKVSKNYGSIANGALYVFDSDFVEYLEVLEGTPRDFSVEIIPKLLGRVQTCYTDKVYMDIGTPEMLEEARMAWKGAD
jgi:mannose-1-phosphate guanylyltransferase